jgi:hypothetical protein
MSIFERGNHSLRTPVTLFLSSYRGIVTEASPADAWGQVLTLNSGGDREEESNCASVFK